VLLFAPAWFEIAMDMNPQIKDSEKKPEHLLKEIGEQAFVGSFKDLFHNLNQSITKFGWVLVLVSSKAEKQATKLIRLTCALIALTIVLIGKELWTTFWAH
jgi:hypothetical protein